MLRIYLKLYFPFEGCMSRSNLQTGNIAIPLEFIAIQRADRKARGQKKVIVFAMIEINLKCHSFVYRLLRVKSFVLSAGVLRWDAIKICHHNKEFPKQKKNVFVQTNNRFEFLSGNMMCSCWFCCCWLEYACYLLINWSICVNLIILRHVIQEINGSK